MPAPSIKRSTPPDRYVRIGDAARMCSMSTDWVRAAIHSKQLKAHQPGENEEANWRILVSNLRNWWGAPLIGVDVPSSDRYVRVGDAARMCDVRADTIRTAIKDEALTAHQPTPINEDGRPTNFRILVSNLRAWWGAPLLGEDVR